MTEWNNPTRITGLKGDTGKDTYAIALTTPGGTVFTENGRGSISPSAITIIAKLSNLPDLTLDNWKVDGASFYVTGNSITINYDDITSSMITVTATSGEYTASVGLTVVSQNAPIEYLGSLTLSVPTTSLKGEDIINGDFFLCSNSFTEDDSEYGGVNLISNSEGIFKPNKEQIDNYEIYSSTSVYLENGKQYTLSGTTNGNFSYQHNPAIESDNCLIWVVGGDPHINVVVSSSDTGTTGTTFTWNNDTGIYYIRVNVYHPNSSNTIYCEKLKIEEGAISTEWKNYTYEVGQIYEYWYGNWQVSNNSSKIMTAMGDFIEIDKAVDPNVYSQIIAKQIVAKNIVAQDIYAQSGTIEGILKSLNYADDGNIPISGYQLNGIDSTIRAYDAIFGGNCTLYGKIINGLLTTQEEVPGNKLTIPSYDAWKVLEASDAISDISESDLSVSYGDGVINTLSSFSDIVGILNSYSINKMAKVGTNKLIWSAGMYSHKEGEFYKKTVTIPFTGTYILSSENSKGAYGVKIYNDDGVYLYDIDTDSATATTTVDFKKGDILTIEVYTNLSNYNAYACIKFYTSNTNSIILYNSSDNILHELSGFYKESSYSLSITSPQVFISSNNINYILGKTIINYLSNFSSNVNIFVSYSDLYYDASHYTSIVKFVKNSYRVLFYYSSDEYIDIESANGYKLHGTITPVAKNEAVITSSLYPTVAADDSGNGKDIGTSEKRYRNIFSKNINTGQGSNELYPMNQGVRTTDNVSFANLNPPIDNNDTSIPSIGVGGFTFAYNSSRKNINFTLPSNGTYMCIMSHYNSNSTDSIYIERYNGGESTIYCRYVAVFRLS